MAKARVAYKIPEQGAPLITTVSAGCKTPELKIKYSNLVKPFYYPNSPKVPRYSMTLVLDPNDQKQSDFLAIIQSMEKKEGVESIIKNETEKEEGKIVLSGKYTIKFQTKENVPVYMINDKGEEVLVKLENEIADGETVIVEYDVMRYTKKNTADIQHGLSYKLTKVIYIPIEE